MSTWLEAIAYERDHAEAGWEHGGRVGRRLMVLAVLADQAEAARRNADENVNPRKPYVSAEMLAQAIADRLALPGCRRLGSGANGPRSWTGYMASSLRIVPTLRALEKAGLVRSRYEPETRTRSLYAVTLAGLAYLDERSP